MGGRLIIVLMASAAFFISFGLLFTVGTLADLKTIGQFRKLLGFDYMSLMDSFELGGRDGMSNDFFTGVALLILGNILLMPVKSTRRFAKIVVGGLFIFVAFSLVYACLDTRIGVR